MNTTLANAPRRHRQIFVSHAAADNEIAHRVADSLRRAGLSVLFDAWEIQPSDSIAEKIDAALSASDVVLVLLSPASVESRWVQAELSAAFRDKLRDRAILIIPALIADCEIPPPLQALRFFDMRSDLDRGLQQLTEELGAAPKIDFAKLDARGFENLVADLLVDIGFSVKRAVGSDDSGIDLVASLVTRDPFGSSRPEVWAVETKFYRDQRVSIGALRQMIGYLMTSGFASKGLVVTNGQLTSVARSYLHDARTRSGYELRVIDGTELVQLVSARPALVDKHFASTEMP
jgi:hypothetical protein